MYTLMTVDDSSIIRNSIERFGKTSKIFTVIAKAHDGDEAINLFREYEPDLITMDITMPHMDGLECIKALKSINPKVKILVVSALSDKATGIRALKYGAKGFVSKPFSEEEFIKAIKHMISV